VLYPTYYHKLVSNTIYKNVLHEVFMKPIK